MAGENYYLDSVYQKLAEVQETEEQMSQDKLAELKTINRNLAAMQKQLKLIQETLEKNNDLLSKIGRGLL